ncbi:MAG: DUF4124 domain-containing protein [Lysobacterales bacterium]|jgi:hypothetical protein
MKVMNPNKIFAVTVLLLLVLVCGQAGAQVYKTVDEDGNVVYTDQPPKDGSGPMELPPLSIVEAPDYEEIARPKTDMDEDEDNELSLRQLRNRYRGFAIISPENEQSLWNPQGLISMAWQAPYPLQQGMQVRASMDGEQIGLTRDRVIPITRLDRGAHTLEAVLVDARGRTVATAEPVTFFIRQPSVIINRPAARPNGG